MNRSQLLALAERLKDAATLLTQTDEPDEALEVATRAEDVARDIRCQFRAVEWMGL